MDNKYIPTFLWIKSFRSISNMGFHFTNEYIYTYNSDTNILTRKKNKDYVRDFYGDKMNISAIVGMNGAGKTTIMSAIMECFNFSSNEAKCIIAFSNGVVWSNESGISYYEFHKNNDSLKLNDNNRKGVYSYYEPKPPVSCIYYSQAFDWSQLNIQSSSIINLSSANLLSFSERINPQKQHRNSRNFFVDEFNKQIRFTEQSDNEVLKVIQFELPSIVYISPVGYNIDEVIESMSAFYIDYLSNEDREQITRNLPKEKYCREKGIARLLFQRKFIMKPDEGFVNEYLSYYINSFINNDKKTDYVFKDYFIEYLSLTLFYVLFKCFGGRYTGGISVSVFVNAFFETIKARSFKSYKNWERVGALFFNVYNVLESTHEKIDYEAKKEIIELKALFDYINDNMIPNINPSYICDAETSRSFYLRINVGDMKDNDPFRITFKEFWNKYEIVSRYCDVFECSWNLSSGEISRLSLYSRLYDVCVSNRWQKGEYNVLYRSKNSILILFDEADMLLHPEWQRSLISDIIAVFPKIFPGQYISVIIATHSPIMLSDIPRQNVLFLKKEGEIKAIVGSDTFASNIFQLFREGFFIGETGIGVFAEKKLKDIVGYIHGKNDASGKKLGNEEIIKLISSVGDAFLRNKLKEEYLLYRSKAKTIEEKQAEKITALESEKGELLEKQRKLEEQKAADVQKIRKALEKLELHEQFTVENNKESAEESEETPETVRDLKESAKENEDIFKVVRKLLREIAEQEEE